MAAQETLVKKEENSQQNKLLHQMSGKPNESMSGVNLCPLNSQNGSVSGQCQKGPGNIKMEKMS